MRSRRRSKVMGSSPLGRGSGALDVPTGDDAAGARAAACGARAGPWCLTRISAQLVGRKGDGRRALTRPGRSEPDLVALWGNRLACLLSTSDAADDLICVVLG